METWMVTGTGGFLGKRIVEYWQKDGGKKVLGFDHAQLDFTDEEAVEQVFSAYHPDVLVHAGAISDTGQCERNPDLSWKMNVGGVQVLARACRKHDTKLIYCSSDQVYFGLSGLLPHTEEEELYPANVYGRHKLEAERFCTQTCPDSVSLRLCWMYDIPSGLRPAKPNFVTQILEAVKEKRPMVQPVHDHRGLTYAADVVKHLGECRNFPGGVYNWGCENQLNTYETVRQVLKLLGADESLVAADEERFREEPRNLCMDMGKTKALGVEFPGTVEGIAQCLKEYGMLAEK